jgi:hypothetical protein
MVRPTSQIAAAVWAQNAEPQAVCQLVKLMLSVLAAGSHPSATES